MNKLAAATVATNLVQLAESVKKGKWSNSLRSEWIICLLCWIGIGVGVGVRVTVDGYAGIWGFAWSVFFYNR